MLIPYEDIGFCFTDLPRENIVREISNYRESYDPDEVYGHYYERSTVERTIFFSFFVLLMHV
ncbi:hypothetical protein C5167_040946 [Papaver somniferum]|uniref:Uncharacterized protein n=1 Tax=Papaver somniferum TaxID=3469 RepID=A0A4Y7IJR6_PAPSO|nr:hypothetical protein C5167_040946 [Papaver somniferum]